MNSPRVLALVLVAVGAALSVAGCSSSEDTAATTTSAASSTCESVQGLSAALTDLVSSDTLSGGTTGIDAALADVQTAFDTVEASASADFGTDVDAVGQALDDLGSAIDGLGDESASDTLSALETSLNAVVDSFDALSADVSSQLTDCQLTTPTTVGS